jgi:hypothetical protein
LNSPLATTLIFTATSKSPLRCNVPKDSPLVESEIFMSPVYEIFFDLATHPTHQIPRSPSMLAFTFAFVSVPGICGAPDASACDRFMGGKRT